MKRRSLILLMIIASIFTSCKNEAVVNYVNEEYNNNQKRVTAYLEDNSHKCLVYSHLYIPTYANMDYALILRVNEKNNDRDELKLKLFEIVDENKKVVIQKRNITVPSLRDPIKQKGYYQTIYRYEIKSSEINDEDICKNNSFMVRYVIDNNVYVERLTRFQKKGMFLFF